MAVEPLAGQRTTPVTERRTRGEGARVVQRRLLRVSPLAAQVVLGMDHLTPHGIASLYEAFAPEGALALATRVAIHSTPKPGSWLNMAETARSIVARQCLDRRIDDRNLMSHAIAAWQAERHGTNACIPWPFKTADARIQLKRLYPSFDM